MRRALAALAVLTIAGCGSGGTNGGPAIKSATNNAAGVVHSGVTAGRLGDATLARPGEKHWSGAGAIPGKSKLPRSLKNALAGEAACPNSDVDPTPGNLPVVAEATFCLMNAVRAENGLPALTQQDQLAKASVDHSQDMADQDYFAHDSLDGRDVVARLTAVAYIPDDAEWVVGENLAWGSGALAAPKALIQAWMNSPPHRANLLAPDFKEVGMGVVFGTPDKSVSSGVTVTTDFGTRTTVSSSEPTASATSTPASKKKRAKSARKRCAKRRGAARRRCLRAARRARR